MTKSKNAKVRPGALLFHGSQLYQHKIKETLDFSYKLKHTSHAISESKKDKHGSFNLPTKLPQTFEIVELEQNRGKNTKYVLRYMLDNVRDLVIVIRPEHAIKSYVITTAWVNLATDTHDNVNIGRYNLPNMVKY